MHPPPPHTHNVDVCANLWYAGVICALAQQRNVVLVFIGLVVTGCMQDLVRYDSHTPLSTFIEQAHYHPFHTEWLIHIETQIIMWVIAFTRQVLCGLESGLQTYFRGGFKSAFISEFGFRIFRRARWQIEDNIGTMQKLLCYWIFVETTRSSLSWMELTEMIQCFRKLRHPLLLVVREKRQTMSRLIEGLELEVQEHHWQTEEEWSRCRVQRRSNRGQF